MRHLKTKNILMTALIAASLLAGRLARADYVTLSIPNTTGAVTNFTVASNMVAQVVYLYLTAYNTFSVTTHGQTAHYGNGTPTVNPVIAGPATITLSTLSSNTGDPGICTLLTCPSSPSLTNSVPSNAVVIPADGGGPVTIILESSVDLVSWTAALPGTYGTTATNRFFRVRAQR